ncbi:MFS transporter [Streptomyces boncukensis]|uniref:MFS transporter n=1 Tax=Streptomyces boncukensis TaxID=2711219 RepID=A0A6G4WPU7_9ACTN|nr:MFS transporter [Streptomyces boncukensis]NGO67289.1 MFS transporter [Streptomyces boncukensis]
MYLASSRETGRRPDGTAARSGGTPAARSRVAGPVFALGAVSLVTDISSEMVTAVLPLYFVVGLGLNPLQFGFLDGLHNGVTALVRLAGGHAADRRQCHKLVAGGGYALSALSRLGLLLAGSSTGGIGAALTADRVGKGVRTAPRDALISLSSPPEALGRSFGVHRAMDTTGALLGPLAAFALLWATAEAYDAVFVVSFCVGLLGVLLFWALVPGRGSPELGRTAAGPGPPPLRAVLCLLGNRRFARLLCAASVLGAVTVGDAFVYLLLQRRLGFATSWFPLLPLGTAAVFLLLAVPLGRLADRTGRRIPYLYGHGALLAVYLLLLGPVGGWPLLCGALLLHGAFYAATDGVLMALAAPALPVGQQAGGMALLQTGQALGRLLAAVGFGAAWTLWGAHTALVLASAHLAAVLVPAALLLRPHARTGGRAPVPDEPEERPC